jgi:hypothetical protein
MDSWAGPSSSKETAGARDFDHFLRRYEAANSAFINGDPAPWLALTAQHDPVSVFGGFGGVDDERVDAVRRRYSLAASAFRPHGSTVTFTYLVQDVHDPIAYTVAIESTDVLHHEHGRPQPQVLRTTMIFRRETDGWKIVHRHADPLIDLHLPVLDPPSTPTETA